MRNPQPPPGVEADAAARCNPRPAEPARSSQRNAMRSQIQPIPRRHPDSAAFRRLAGHWLPLLVVALAAPGQLAAGENDLADALRDQQRLLDQVGDEEGIGQAGLLAGVEDTEANPRIAPRTPIPRDLPVAIFDEQKVVVAEGEWGGNKRMNLLRRTLDADGDGSPEVERYIDPKSDFMIRQIEDRNYDGVQDAWTDFEWGAVIVRVLDTNDDGNPDTWETYADGRMTRREVDRDDDGIRDAFYSYDGDSLTKETHDVNNDRKIDLLVTYQARRRVRSEEDQNHDGKMDRWTTFTKNTVQEIPARIDRDTRGRGVADTFEYFDAVDGRAILARRDEDVNGDGKVDIVSIYVEGKLVRREIADPALLPGV